MEKGRKRERFVSMRRTDGGRIPVRRRMSVQFDRHLTDSTNGLWQQLIGPVKMQVYVEVRFVELSRLYCIVWWSDWLVDSNFVLVEVPRNRETILPKLVHFCTLMGLYIVHVKEGISPYGPDPLWPKQFWAMFPRIGKFFYPPHPSNVDFAEWQLIV